MNSKLEMATLVTGVIFALQGIAWLFAPGWAAASLGMSVLDGLGRSTQFGDFAAFFLTLGISILVGTIPERRGVLYFPAGLLASAALCRTMAWAFHGAAFASSFIFVEVAASLLLLCTALKPEGND